MNVPFIVLGFKSSFARFLSILLDKSQNLIIFSRFSTVGSNFKYFLDQHIPQEAGQNSSMYSLASSQLPHSFRSAQLSALFLQAASVRKWVVSQMIYTKTFRENEGAHDKEYS